MHRFHEDFGSVQNQCHTWMHKLVLKLSLLSAHESIKLECTASPFSTPLWGKDLCRHWQPRPWHYPISCPHHHNNNSSSSTARPLLPLTQRSSVLSAAAWKCSTVCGAAQRCFREDALTSAPPRLHCRRTCRWVHRSALSWTSERFGFSRATLICGSEVAGCTRWKWKVEGVFVSSHLGESE